MHSPRKLSALVALSLVALTSAAGCGDPCQDLAHKICDCETTEARQQACTANVDADAQNRKPTKQEEQRCEELLDSCTCEKLAAGDWAACGLALEQ